MLSVKLILFFSVIHWGISIDAADNRLNKLCRKAGSVIGCILNTFDTVKLVHAFITLRLQYCLQLIQNAVAKILTLTRKRECISPVFS